MGLVVPIGRLLRDGYFTPEDITLLTAVFAETLEHLRLTDRNDPAVTLVAKRIIEFARQGGMSRALLKMANRSLPWSRYAALASVARTRLFEAFC